MLEMLLIFVVQFCILLFGTFGITSILLSGSIFEKARNKWKCFWGDSVIKDLSHCSMCVSFWISLALQYFIMATGTIFLYLVVSFCVSGLVWAMYSAVQALMWHKAEKELTYNINAVKAVRLYLDAE